MDATDAAIAIWRAGLDAVKSGPVVRDQFLIRQSSLTVAQQTFELSKLRKICVVGGGKAGAGMAAGLCEALVPLSLGDRLFGWLNVPEGTAAEYRGNVASQITLHEARPAGVNQPTVKAVEGTREILKRVASLGPNDLCVCLLSGGGSALLPLPTDDITLDQKIQLTKDMSAAGATIQQLNAVRRHYSQVKAGGLARHCKAGHLIALIISDVIGDPLDFIASGPTVLESGANVSLVSVIEQLERIGASQSLAFVRHVQQAAGNLNMRDAHATCKVRNHIIANNQRAVDAAVKRAGDLGFQCVIVPSETPTTTAEEVGVDLARRLIAILQDGRRPTCIVSGGEPIVRLADDSVRGKGGRNQQLVLAALCELERVAINLDFSVLSGGTDGEDGPTDCAGAVCDPGVMRRSRALSLDPADYLARNDAYEFFKQSEGLFKTGPTNTNVCDVRVLVVSC